MPLRIVEPVGGANGKPPDSSVQVRLQPNVPPWWLTNSVHVVRSTVMPTGLITPIGRGNPPMHVPCRVMCKMVDPVLVTSHSVWSNGSYVTSFGAVCDGVHVADVNSVSGL